MVKSVRYFDFVMVHEIMSLDEYSEQERSDAWYAKAETNAMMRACAQLVAQGHGPNHRGLEKVAGPAMQKRKRRRQDVYEIVQCMQQLQQEQSLPEASTEIMAEALRRTSASAMEEAHQVGLCDQAMADVGLSNSKLSPAVSSCRKAHKRTALSFSRIFRANKIARAETTCP